MDHRAIAATVPLILPYKTTSAVLAFLLGRIKNETPPLPRTYIIASTPLSIPHANYPPTPHLIALSHSVYLVTTPTIQHLLAYLSAFPPPAAPENAEERRIRALVLLNPLSLHREAGKISAQGISRTFAAAVEATERVGAQLLVAEMDELSEEGWTDEEGNRRDVWDEEIPLLDGIIGGGTGRKRTVPIRRVVGRWCDFVEEGEDNRTEEAIKESGNGDVNGNGIADVEGLEFAKSMR